jgi:hypothetical protein
MPTHTKPDSNPAIDYIDACADVAYRLEVVNILLHEHIDRCAPTKEDRRGEGTGGHEVNIAIDLVTQAVQTLRAAAKATTKTGAAS